MAGTETKDIAVLKAELEELRIRLYETEETLQAIRNGQVDAIIVSGDEGDKIFSLTSSETPYRIIIEQMDEGALTVSSKGVILYCNNRFAEIVSASPEKIVGADLSSFILKEDWPELKRLFKIGRRKPARGEVSVTAGNKTLRLSLVPLPKHMEGDVCITVSDVTEINNYQNFLRDMVDERTSELKSANRKLAEDENELVKSREKLNLALENGQIGWWEWNLETNEMFWDERTERMFGLKAGSFEKTFAASQSHVHEEDIPHINAEIANALENNGQHFESIFRTKPRNGESNYISSKAIIVRDAKGKAVSMSGVCFDVTDMKKGAEKALIKLNEELLRSNTDLQQFAYVASHDLQEPLRMVSSFTQLLQQRFKDKLGEDGNEYIRYAVEGSKRMYELLNGLLTYSRIQTKGREFIRVDMNAVVSKVLENLSLIIKEKKAVINYSSLPLIFADENQMIQLIQNLLENSLKFSNGAPQITIDWHKENESYVFQVTDRGIGIEPQYFERIFRIFQRLHRSDEYGGTGIGLAVCKRIVERHGGRIWVTSEMDQGSHFCFSLPASSQNPTFW